MKTCLRLAPLFAFLGCISAQADCDFDDFPRMEGMSVSALGQSVQWNHLPLNGRSFRVSSNLEEVKAFYGREWKDAVDYTEFNGWDQIMHINSKCIMLVQVKAQNERYSYGRMLLTNPPTKDAGQTPLGQGMPVPLNAQVISDMQSDDDIRKGRMLLLLNDDDMHRSRAWYESEMVSQGWTLDSRSIQPNAIVLSYSKGRELMTIGFLDVEDGRTQILVNRMDR